MPFYQNIQVCTLATRRFVIETFVPHNTAVGEQTQINNFYLVPGVTGVQSPFKMSPLKIRLFLMSVNRQDFRLVFSIIRPGITRPDVRRIPLIFLHSSTKNATIVLFDVAFLPLHSSNKAVYNHIITPLWFCSLRTRLRICDVNKSICFITSCVSFQSKSLYNVRRYVSV